MRATIYLCFTGIFIDIFKIIYIYRTLIFGNNSTGTVYVKYNE